ncbi:MAG: hypothetical protein HY248_03605 [Fimbriimonas ginsengisoli]|uniref:YbjN domain-containing protein n=1 Tax=Fimbriimonas ginsengisoli TaxID=1005039 RepID=A0A931PU44_FIMGI|nr:hypothetical protein [Fimbriimonas ginsengisoli]MBI3721616.1 hypothetical protein [Fimbriimonas ginsengisoli]
MSVARDPTSLARIQGDVQPVTDDSLKATLDGMGYEPKKLSKGFLISIKRDSWTYYIQLVLSSDSSKLGFNSNLGAVESPEAVTAEQWKKLLVSNEDIDPSFFYFDESHKKLYLHRSLDNRSLSASFLRQQIDNFCANIKSTGDLWKFTK